MQILVYELQYRGQCVYLSKIFILGVCSFTINQNGFTSGGQASFNIVLTIANHIALAQINIIIAAFISIPGFGFRQSQSNFSSGTSPSYPLWG